MNNAHAVLIGHTLYHDILSFWLYLLYTISQWVNAAEVTFDLSNI